MTDYIALKPDQVSLLAESCYAPREGVGVPLEERVRAGTPSGGRRAPSSAIRQDGPNCSESAGLYRGIVRNVRAGLGGIPAKAASD
jgi:hypothetical protein